MGDKNTSTNSFELNEIDTYGGRSHGSQTTLLARDSMDDDVGSPRPRSWSFQSFFGRLISVKPVSEAQNDAHSGHGGYKRALTALDLTLIGIGGIIGAGIFVITGRAAAEYAGPALVISFIFAGVVAGLSSLCYAEMASLVPISGSAYTYAYTTLGELVAWIIGWDLTLEYLVGAATVAVGWSEYLNNFLLNVSNGGSRIHPQWSNATWVWLEHGQRNVTATGFYRNMVDCPDGPCAAYFNAPAAILSLLVMSVLLVGVRISSTVNGVFVTIKVLIVLLFIFVGIPFIKTENYHPFIPENQGWGKYGWSGIFQASTTVFFAYIGFDAVSTAAQEAKNPRRDLPIGILSSLGICTLLYIAVTVVLTGVKKYTEIDVGSPVANAIPLRWLSIVIDIGALAGLLSVMMVLLLGQPRILQVMASDGLLPSMFATISSKTGVPVWGTVVTGVACALFAGVLPIDILGNMTSVGTLFGFAVVCAAVPILRYTKPDMERKFEVPGGKIIGGYIIPIVGFIASAVLIAVGSIASLVRLFVWMAIGLFIYMVYGYRNSKLGSSEQAQLAFQKSKGERLTLQY